jgi:hypothetical protein
MTLRHLLTHLGCVYSRSLLLSEYNNLLLPFTAVHHIRQIGTTLRTTGLSISNDSQPFR